MVKLNLKKFFNPLLSDKDTIHSYLPVYEQLIPSVTPSGRPIRILEIGIERGGSILAWALALDSLVMGIDINPPPVWLTGFQNVQILKGDAYTEEAVKTLDGFPGFDMIVEDGSHTPEHIMFVANNYMKLLRPGGILVIEDVPSNAVTQQLQQMKGVLVTTYDLRPKKGRFDDVLVVLQHVADESDTPHPLNPLK